MAHKLAQAGLSEQVSVDSAGIGGWHEGELADPRTRQIADLYGFTCPTRARQIRPKDIRQTDLFLVMDEHHMDYLASHLSGEELAEKVFYLRHFDPTAPPNAKVSDPYVHDFEFFQEIYAEIDRATDGLLAHLKDRLELIN